MSEAVCGASVVFAYQDEKCECEEIVFHVPENLLWSAEGLAYLYEWTRASVLCKPGTEAYDDDAWNSWHITEINVPEADETFMLIPDLRSNPPEPEKP